MAYGLKRLNRRMDRMQGAGKDTSRIQRRIGYLQKRHGITPRPETPAAPEQPATPLPRPTGNGIPSSVGPTSQTSPFTTKGGLTDPSQEPVGQPMTPGMQANYMETLLPQTGGFESRDVEASKLYDFRLKEGQKAMDRLNAARGTTDSNVEREGNLDLVARLTAEESDRLSRLQQQEADRAQVNAGRLWDMQAFESTRQDGLGQNQFNNLLSLLELQSRQNPMQYAYGAGGQLADAYTGYGKDRFNQISKNYSPVTPPPSGGGGGGGIGPYVPPFPSRPDFSQAQLAGVLGQGGSNSNWGKIAGDAIGAIIGAL